MENNMKINKEMLTKLYVVAGCPIIDIAKYFGVHERTVYRHIERYGLKRDEKTYQKPCYEYPYTKEEVVAMYNSGKTIEQLAKQLNIAVKTFYRWLEHYDIPVKTSLIPEKVLPTKEQLEKDVLENGLGVVKLMKKYELRHDEVRKLLDEYGIKKPVMEYDIEAIRQYYMVERHSWNDTMKHFNMTERAFRIIQHKYGMKRSNIPDKRTPYKGTKEELYEDYIVQNKTVGECAEKYGVSIGTLQNALTKFGIMKSKEQRLANVYKTNMEKYGAKTKFGTGEFKEWRKENVDKIQEKSEHTFMEKYGAKSFVESQQAKEVWKMGTSLTEQKIYDKLVTKFPDVQRWVKTDEYPYECDFYIPSNGMYIEYQGFYTHGEEPFDENNEEHVTRYNELMESGLDYKKDEAMVWGIRDVQKRQRAHELGLNWHEFFSEEEFDKWFETLN